MADVIVVGAGGGGAVVAFELAEAGLDVMVLEAGPWLYPDRDYSRMEDDMSGILHGRLRWGPGDRSRPPWIRRREGAGLILQAAGVGGTTLHYNGISPRAYPEAVDEGWPMPYRDLVAYYERVEAFLPVRQVDDLATKDAVFAAGCESIGLLRDDAPEVTKPVWRPTYNAILPIARMEPGEPLRYPEVDGCTMCGHCLVGCPNPVGAPLERKAKRATNVSYVPAAVATGRCEIVPDAFATAVLHDDGRARGVRWRETSGGVVREAEARAVVLAGGSVESPRLWMNSGLPDPHDVVGRYLTMHLQDFVTGIFDHDVLPYVGQVTMARADFPGYGTLWSQGFGPQAFAIVVVGGGGTWWDTPCPDEPWDVEGRWYGPEAQELIASYPRSLTVAVCTDDEEVPANRVTLTSPDEWPADEHGPVPKVVYHPTPRSVERQDWLARKAAEILRGAGARKVHRTRIRPVFMTHLMGTMRMGADPAASVFDADGQAHHVRGLWVGDTSAMPNGIGGPNPTLTAQALATRTAERIARALG